MLESLQEYSQHKTKIYPRRNKTVSKNIYEAPLQSKSVSFEPYRQTEAVKRFWKGESSLIQYYFISLFMGFYVLNISNSTGTSLSSIFNTQGNTYNNNIEQFTCDNRRNFFFDRTVEVQNRLPNSVMMACNVKIYKEQLDF